MATPLSHSTKRTLFASGVIPPRRTREDEHEADYAPYVPECMRRYDPDYDVALPVRAREVE